MMEPAPPTNLTAATTQRSASLPDLTTAPQPPQLPALLLNTAGSSGAFHHQHHSSLSVAGSSAPGSPTASVSGYSLASTSSTVPFSRIAQQRKQQVREAALQEAAQALLADAALAFDLRMQCHTQDIATLQELNEAAAQQYSSSAEIAAALGQFVSDLSARQAAAKEALAVLPQLDRQLELLGTAVSQLDRRSRQLESRLGLKPLSGSGGSSSMSATSSAYGYLAQSVSTLTAAGVSTAAAGLQGCLGGSGAAAGAPP